MNKSEVIKYVAEDTGMTQTAVGDVLRSIEFLSHQIAHRGEELNLGFLKIKTVAKPARIGRNPRTGATVEIAASKGVKIVASKALKDAANGVAK